MHLSFNYHWHFLLLKRKCRKETTELNFAHSTIVTLDLKRANSGLHPSNSARSVNISLTLLVRSVMLGLDINYFAPSPCCEATVGLVKVPVYRQQPFNTHPKGVGNSVWIFLSWATFFLFVASKKKECRKINNK